MRQNPLENIIKAQPPEEKAVVQSGFCLEKWQSLYPSQKEVAEEWQSLYTSLKEVVEGVSKLAPLHLEPRRRCQRKARPASSRLDDNMA